MVVLLWIAAAVLLLFAVAGSDLAFVPCNGAFRLDSALPRCRIPVYYYMGFVVCATVAASMMLFLLARGGLRRVRAARAGRRASE